MRPRNQRWFVVALVGAVVAGCVNDNPTGPAQSKGAPNAGARGVSVMTQNLYLGADLTPILAATNPIQIPPLVANAWQTILSNEFPERARALAALIEERSPHLIGLQEVALYRTQSPSDPTPATTVALDYLQLVLDALEERGLEYSVVAIQEETDVELPVLVGITPVLLIDDLRMTLRDVTLARSDVPTMETSTANYQATFTLSLGPASIVFKRGYVSTVASVGVVDVRFVNTHLESQTLAPIQVAQTQELLGLLSTEERPIVLVGDFNSAANVIQTPTYDLLVAGGFVDTWNLRPRQSSGLTCCQDEDLLNEPSDFDQRLDLIFTRELDRGGADNVATVHVEVVGDDTADRTDSGRWISDHAGVAAILRIPPGLHHVNATTSVAAAELE